MCSKKASQFISFLPWVNKGKPHRLAPLAWFPYPKQQEQNQLAYKFWLMDLFLLDTSFCSKSLMGWADFGWWHPRDQSSAASELIQSFIQQYLWGSFYVEQVGREEKFLRRIEFPCPFFVWTFKYLVLNLYFSRLNSLFISFGCAGSSLLSGLSLAPEIRATFWLWSCPCGGFSCCGTHSPGCVGFRSCSSRFLEHRLSSCGPRA